MSSVSGDRLMHFSHGSSLQGFWGARVPHGSVHVLHGLRQSQNFLFLSVCNPLLRGALLPPPATCGAFYGRTSGDALRSIVVLHGFQESKGKYSMPLQLWLSKCNSPSWNTAQVIKNRLCMWEEKPRKHCAGLLFYTRAILPVLLWSSVPGKWCTVIQQHWFLQQQCFSPGSTPSPALARFNTALLMRCKQTRSVKLCLGETRFQWFCQALN